MAHDVSGYRSRDGDPRRGRPPGRARLGGRRAAGLCPGVIADDAVRHHPRRRLAARSVQPSSKPSFASDIGPIFSRLAQNQWVNAGFCSGASAAPRTSPISWRRSPAHRNTPGRCVRAGSRASKSCVRCHCSRSHPTGVRRRRDLPGRRSPRVVRDHPLQYDMLRQWATVTSLTTIRTRHRPRRSTTSRSPRTRRWISPRSRTRSEALPPRCEMT